MPRGEAVPDRTLQLLIELHRGLPRLGPGDAASTRRALALCAGLPAAPDILDAGCGTGAQSLELVRACAGQVTAVDLCAEFVDALWERCVEERLTHRVRSLVADMGDLPFPPESFDLVWSEGAAYSIGFDRALACWAPLLRPGGYLAASELSWFRPDPPAELREFWAEGYPAMRSVEANRAAARERGWEVVGGFALPVSAWTVDYYGPLRERLPEFCAAHAGDAEAEAVAAGTRREMELMGRYGDVCGYEFYVLRR